MTRLTIILLIGIVCWGCPYEALHPLDQHPTIGVDSVLLGLWVKKDPGASTLETLQISKKSDSIYLVNRNGKVQEGSVSFTKRFNMLAFASRVENENFFNAERIERDPSDKSTTRKYFIVKYRIGAGNEYDTLFTQIVSDHTYRSDKTFRNSTDFKQSFVSEYKSGRIKYDTDYSGFYIRRARKMN